MKKLTVSSKAIMQRHAASAISELVGFSMQFFRALKPVLQLSAQYLNCGKDSFAACGFAAELLCRHRSRLSECSLSGRHRRGSSAGHGPPLFLRRAW